MDRRRQYDYGIFCQRPSPMLLFALQLARGSFFNVVLFTQILPRQECAPPLAEEMRPAICDFSLCPGAMRRKMHQSFG